MKLSFDQIKSVATGCMEFVEDGGLWLHRFTEAQRNFTYSKSPNGMLQACQAAGITLDFYTDATAFDMTVDGIRDYDNCNRCFDLLVDGCFVKSIDTLHMDEGFCKTPVPYGPYDLHFPLPQGEKRVTVCMPWDASVRILSAELTDGTFCRPHAYKRTLVAFGDSITHGAFAKYSCTPYICQTARLLDAKLYNFGIGGERFRGNKIVPGSYPKADIVTVAYGTNDYSGQTKEAFEEKMPAFLRQLTAEFAETPIFVILPLWRKMEAWEEEKHLGSLQTVRDRIAEECAKYPNITVCDGSKWVPHLKDFYGDSKWVHPNDLGMSHFAMGLSKAILQASP